jgi:O-glycosyl hydrolase
MKNYTSTVHASRFVAGLALSVIALAFIGVPTSAYAATYAFVNRSDEVSMVVSNSPTEAMAMGLNIAPTSGVMLLNATNSGIVGNQI